MILTVIQMTSTELSLLENLVTSWTVAEVGKWVSVILRGTLSHHAVKFAHHEINGERLLIQNDMSLQVIGIADLADRYVAVIPAFNITQPFSSRELNPKNLTPALL